MIEVEVIGRRRFAPKCPPPSAIRRLCALAAGSAGVGDGHLAVHFVDEARIAELNLRHRGRAEPTDVLSFPIDGAGGGERFEPPERAEGAEGAEGADVVDRGLEADRAERAHGVGGRDPVEDASPPRELGDVVICPPRTIDLREAIVHGVLHLVGMDHETDDGEMLAVQARLLAEAEQ